MTAPTPAHSLPPYPAYRPSGVPWLGDVPAHWEVRRLKTLARIVNGATPATLTPEYWGGDITWITPEDLGRLDTPYVEHGARFITQKGYDSCGTTIAPAGSLVISTRAPIGHIAILRRPACVNQGCRLIIPADAIQSGYLYYQLAAAKPEIASFGKGTTFMELSKADLASFRVACPPPDEQAAIASYLDHAVDRINRARQGKARLAELLQEYRQAAIHHAVTRGLNPEAPLKPSGIKWLDDVPAHWEVRRLKTMARIVNGATPSTLTPEYWGGDITWLTPEDLGRLDTAYIEHGARSITQKGYDSCGTTIAPAGSLVISTRAPIGHIAILRRPACVNQGCRLIITADAIQSGYLYYQLAVAKSEIASFGKGTTFMELSKADLASFRFACPPPAEQAAIAAHLDWLTAKLDAAIAGARQSAALLDEYRAALIAAAVTGQVDVRAAAPAPPPAAPPP